MNEADWAAWTLDQLGGLEWVHLDSKAVAPGSGERQNWHDIVLTATLRASLENLNPDVPIGYLDQALVEVITPHSQDAITENFRLHKILLNGYTGVSYIDHDGQEVTPTIRFIASDAARNRYHAVNQVTVRSRAHERRFDVVLYVNGLPVSIIELKQASAAKATSEVAYNQLQTYLHLFSMAFRFSCFVVASDYLTARYGTAFTPWNHFAPWNVDDDGAPSSQAPQATTAIPPTNSTSCCKACSTPSASASYCGTSLHLTRPDAGLKKRIAKPHQYFAVTKAVASTVHAVDTDDRAGVVWHTQGSGKSMEMELYTAKVMRHPRLANPTILTDRTEPDTQLFEGFKVSALLPERPKQVANREKLRAELSQRRSSGIYFTTLQEFGLTKDERDALADHPLLSERRNTSS